MTASLAGFFAPDQFLPHGLSMLWEPWLIRLHAASDLLIAIALFAMPLALLLQARRRPGAVPRPVVTLLVAALLAGATHASAGRLDLVVAGLCRGGAGQGRHRSPRSFSRRVRCGRSCRRTPRRGGRAARRMRRAPTAMCRRRSRSGARWRRRWSPASSGFATSRRSRRTGCGRWIANCASAMSRRAGRDFRRAGRAIAGPHTPMEVSDPGADPEAFKRHLAELKARRPFRDFVFARRMKDRRAALRARQRAADLRRRRQFSRLSRRGERRDDANPGRAARGGGACAPGRCDRGAAGGVHALR